MEIADRSLSPDLGNVLFLFAQPRSDVPLERRISNDLLTGT